MRISKLFLPTLKEVPTDAVITSHILMVRAGMIRTLSAGIYSFLPLGYKMIKKVSAIIQREMDAIDGQEFHLPALNPKELWEQTGRVEAFGETMFQIKNRDYVLAPTHEEVIAEIAANHIKSYRDLPQIWYQIQTKFRNETRPRSGVIRGREFLMKDSYSLDATPEGLDKSYDLHAEAYRKIFSACGLKFFEVGASSGAMGGSGSQEFMVESDAGEDTCAICDNCNYAANVEVASAKVADFKRNETSEELKDIHTPNIRTIDELSDFLKIPTVRCAKSRVYMHNEKPILVLMLGNDEVNESKLLSALGGKVRPAHPDELKEITGADAGSIGPIETRMRVIADVKLLNANNMFSGANKNDYHIGGIDFVRDIPQCKFFDLHFVEAGSGCSNCGSKLRVVKAIELGHIFKLGTKYSEALGAKFLDESGKEHSIIMGSYGIGVERIVACLIEQNHDSKGIKWPMEIAPFKVHLLGVNMKNDNVRSTADKIYYEFNESDIETLYDDRNDVSAGFKFNDADLLGMPLQVIIGEKNLAHNRVEIKNRATGEKQLVEIGQVLRTVQSLIT
ncbi:MAG: proline--tRNA ligase [Bacteroidetes bacterium]|nr:proline--tRNA ligase [Bacteroidota bacterium]MBU2585325.1 proline--tRNA ligase [Bacteroidota bacterium]